MSEVREYKPLDADKYTVTVIVPNYGPLKHYFYKCGRCGHRVQVRGGWFTLPTYLQSRGCWCGGILEPYEEIRISYEEV